MTIVPSSATPAPTAVPSSSPRGRSNGIVCWAPAIPGGQTPVFHESATLEEFGHLVDEALDESTP